MPPPESIFIKAFVSAYQASLAIIEVYQKGVDVEIKDDGSPITIADRRSNDIIIKALSTTPYPVISEEQEIPPYPERKNWNYYWLVDPLDGTKEFVNRNGEFTVNIALIKDQTPVWGIIIVPVLQTAYFSTPFTGARKLPNLNFMNKMNHQNLSLEDIMEHSQQLISCKSLEDSASSVVLISKSHHNPKTIDILNLPKEKRDKTELVSKGSSLKFCVMAEGLAHYHPRRNKTWEWDIAAGHAILVAAGGALISYPSNQEFLYNKQNLINGGFIAFASRSEALKFIAESSL